MAAEVTEILKRCALKITTSKTKERIELCESILVPCIERDDFSEQCVKVAFRLIFAVYSDYRDNRSRKALEKVVKTLADKHGLKAVKFFCAAFTDLENYIKKCYHSHVTSGNILILFKWTSIMVGSVYPTGEQCQGPEWNKLIECHYLSTYGALSAGNAAVRKVVNRKLVAIWKKVPSITEKYAIAISELETSEFSLCLAGELFAYCSKSKLGQALIVKYKKPLIDVYIKNILSSKTKRSTPVLLQCSNYLCHVTGEDFGNLILPALLKALLRNPETVLECTGYLVAALSIDLSKYAVNICKSVVGQLRAKEDIHRQEAALIIKGLADHCSDPNELAELIKYLFSVLAGSEGRLTMCNDRVAILEAIGYLEANSVGMSSSMENLVNIIVEKMVPYLQQEVQESAAVKALSVLALWCKHIVTAVPKTLVEAFKKGMDDKVSTSLIQCGYLQCMAAALKGNTLLQGFEILPQLLKCVERANNQSHQITVMTAGLMASSILVRLSLADIKAESKLGSFWTTFLDEKKMIYVSDKFLQSASPEALQALLSTIQTLFISHPQRLCDANNQPWYHAILFLMTAPSQKLQQDMQSFLHKFFISAGSGAVDHHSSMLAEFPSLLHDNQVMSKVPSLPGLTNGTIDGHVNSASSSASVPSKILVKTLKTLALAPFRSDTSLDESVREDIALSVLTYCHHPLIFSYKKDLWLQILSDEKLDISSFFDKYHQEIIKKITQASNQKVSQHIVSTIASVSSRTLAGLVTHLVSCLSNNTYAHVSAEEVKIMQTAEGEICNKKVLDSLKASEQSKTKNVKKESSAYKYEDQKWSLEYEAEMKRKKKEAGLLSFRDELSDKDKEIFDSQLKIEAEIRIKLKETKQELINLVALLLQAIEFNVAAMKKFIPTVLPVLLHLLNCPLAAESVVPVIVALRKCAFSEENDHLRTLIAQVTLRLLQPQCQLNPSWCQENIQSAASRAVKALHQVTCLKSNGNPDANPLSAPSFTYCFPMLNCILRAGRKAVKCDEDLRTTCLQIIFCHCQLRSLEEETEEVDEDGPELLPRKEMFTLFIEIISTSSGSVQGSHLQQLASSCLLELCKSASGEDGCTVAEPEELDVLLKGLESSAFVLRFSVLKGLLNMTMVLPGVEDETEHSMNVLRRIWVAKFDPDEENAVLGQKLWEESHYTVPESLWGDLLQDLVHDVDIIRQAASLALTQAVSLHPAVKSSVLHKLIELYETKSKIPAPVTNEFGRVISEPYVDPWPARSGIAQALCKLSPCLDKDQVPFLFAFFVPTGLGDRRGEVRKQMLNAALQVVNDHGKDNISNLLPIFEGFLDIADDTRAHDTIRQSVIILMGTLAKHLDKEDPKVKPIVKQLIKALSTPSQQVQQAIAKSLPPLVSAIKDEAPELVKMLLNQLLQSTVYGERKGAAHGLAGLVKGLGILYLKQLNIMATLQEAIQDKKHYRHREGALFAFEMLSTMLGRLFEPYVVHVLPHLLLCFGDTNHYVREATDDTARAVMKHLSAHGVKLVLPSLLTALNEESWRTKSGSVELLGAMAYCAPKQLSSCLPSIVPMLCKVLTDSHEKVQKSGAQALRQIGAVIRNPEIQAISSVLLDALMDPSTNTASCLQVLLQTSFVHFIDAPSLALIMPVLQRALYDRSTETKKMAAQIIGNMYSLTDPKDLLPYLSSLVPGLKQSLLDPVPEVRAVSARALGALVKGMGEEHFEDLLPWLMETLTSENSSVDRSGAAQGISEVLYGLGKKRLDKLMPDVISTTEKSELAPHVREGYLMLYIYIPGTFKNEFTEYVGPILSSIIQGLADEVEFVRDTSLRAGQRIVNMYADTAIELFLPELERGLFDENWRIRHSSIQLLGDLLYKISGVTGKMSTEGDEDDNFGTQHSNQKIINALGDERRNRVLAGLYMGRSDVSLMVRQAALHVWKVIVPNTPRVLREILSTLFALLIGCLASKSFDKRQVAARTLGDLVRKLGERVLPEIIPILEKGLNSDKSNERQGVCVGMSEIVSSTSKEQVTQYVDSLVPTVRRALCDPLLEVREAAAKTFDNLYSTIGSKALDEVLSDLLTKMDDPWLSEYALDGLRQVMQVNSRVVLPYLVPKLIAPPVNARALAILSSVAGEALSKHLARILPALLHSIQESIGTESEQEELEGAKNLVLSVENDDGVRTVIEELLEAAQNKHSGLRKTAVTLLFKFCSETRADYTQFIPLLFRHIIQLLNDEDVDVVVNSWETLKAVIESLQPSDQLQYISPLLQAISFVRDEVKGEELPGFCLPSKGIKCILPVFREGILTGTPELKEQAARGLGEVIKLTSAAALKPSVVNITGPLIRILGDRFSWNVKVAVLETLGLLLGKVGAMLKPFLPQLQTTFVKALNDPNKTVRIKAAGALHQLVTLHTRVDPLFTELQNGVKNNEDYAIKETLLQALKGVIIGAGGKMSDTVRKALTATLLSLLGHGENNIRVACAICFGALATILPDNELERLISDHLTVNDPSVDWTLRHGHAIALSAVLHDAPDKVLACGLYDIITDAAVKHASTDRIPIGSFGVRSLGFLFSHSKKKSQKPPAEIMQTLIKNIQCGSTEVRSLSLSAIKYASNSCDEPFDTNTLKIILPVLIASAKDKNTGVKASAEAAMVDVLKLRNGDDTLQDCCRFLESSTADLLTDMCRKALRRIANQDDVGVDEITRPYKLDME